MSFHFRCRCNACDNDVFFIDSDNRCETVVLKCTGCAKVVCNLSFYDFKVGVNKANEEMAVPNDDCI